MRWHCMSRWTLVTTMEPEELVVWQHPPHARSAQCSQVVIVVIWQRHLRSLLHLSLILLHGFGVDLDFSGKQSDSIDEGQVLISDKLLGQVQERLLVVEVGLSRDVIVAKILFPVEVDLLDLDLTLLDVHLVPN